MMRAAPALLVFSACPAAHAPADAGPAADAGAGDGDVDGGVGDAGPPAPPPARMAFVSNRSGADRVYVLEPSGAVSLVVDEGPALAPALSPDGHTLAFVDAASGVRRIALVDLAAPAADRTPALVPTALDVASSPAFAADGLTLYFEGRAAGGAAVPFGIYRVAVDGTTAEQRLVDGAGPACARDGSVFYVVADGAGGFDVAVMGADGAGPHAVTSGERVLGRPTISPDGATLAYARASSSSSGALSEVVLFDVPSTTTTVLSAPDDGDSEPAFAPDGAALALTSARGGDPDIWLVPVDGSGDAPALLVQDRAVDGAAAFAPAGGSAP